MDNFAVISGSGHTCKLYARAVVERMEIQFLRLLANTPLQIHPTLVYFDKHTSTSNQKHFDAFYKPISKAKNWTANGQVFYSNWINWVYQTTHFDVRKPLMG